MRRDRAAPDVRPVDDEPTGPSCGQELEQPRDVPHPTALGGMDANTFWRQLEVVDGDDFYGERCELGRNEHRYGQRGTFTLYQPGMRRITFYSLRLPRRFPLATERWQVVAQMKQANPSDLAESGTGYGYSPVLAMIADHGRWAVENNWNRIWEAPARKGTWVRFAYDVRYSPDPERGWIRVYADLNGDGDALDPYEAQPTIRTDTLKTEIADPAGEDTDTDGIAAGEAIPAHLRVGLYHDPNISCEPSCRVRVDSVQVVAP
ncbi:MAG: heparin lyase I family protein [Acidothermales bacterium]|nr:heparin lyase I family protein [Acidothermales bacterium]